jgi:flagellar biosynthesis/type III secretory pathway protein FliH
MDGDALQNKKEFDQGYDYGFDQGFKEGFDKGFIEGYDQAVKIDWLLEETEENLQKTLTKEK